MENYVDDKSMINATSVSVASSGGGSGSIISELCLVCGDRASGRHYGAISCEGCKGFFKRSIRKQLGYQCRGQMNCEVTKHHRNRCQFCRLQKCLASGMRSDSVQHERKPILPKKESQQNMSSTSSTAGSFHSRNKIFSHPTTSPNSAGSASGNTPENSTSAAASVFPVGFNFAELTQTLMFASAPYQQQQAQQSPQPQTQIQDSYTYSPEAPSNDEDSLDHNISSVGPQNLSTSDGSGSLPNPTATAVGLIQSTIDKNIITKSLELLNTIQRRIEGQSSVNPSGSNNYDTHVKEEENDDEDINEDFFEFNERLLQEPLINEQNVNFILQAPALVSSYLNVHYVCETGSRVLFLSVYWLKKIPVFYHLSEGIQEKLIRAHWQSIFVIGLSQSWKILSIGTILSTISTNIINLSEIEKIDPQRIRSLCEHASRLHEFFDSMQTLELDDTEYAYCRIYYVFGGQNLQFKERRSTSLIKNYLERIQLSALKSLKTYINDKEPEVMKVEERFNKIISRLMPLCGLDSNIIEELFFSNLIGPVQIDNMIPYILKLGGLGGVSGTGGGIGCSNNNSNSCST